MGALHDIWRIMRFARTRPTDVGANLRWTADYAEALASTEGPIPAVEPNPFTNLANYQTLTPAAGTVVTLTATDQAIGGVPVYAVDLQIRTDGSPPYRATYHTVIAAGALPQWQPGKVLPFRVSLQHRSVLMLG